MTPLEILTSARELIAKEGGWTQGALARDAAGKELDEHAPEACSFCMYGALFRTGGYADECEAVDEFITKAVGEGDFIDFNDARGRTQAEVVSAFDRAIDLARAAEVRA